MDADAQLSQPEAELTARLHTILQTAEADGDARALDRLHTMALGSPAVRPGIVLLIDSAREEVKSLTRPVAESAAAWADLRLKAESALRPDDLTLAGIRLHQAHYVQLCGRPEDLDEAVAVCGRELDWCRAHLDDDHRHTALSRAQLADALSDRGRPADLSTARAMLSTEAGDRRNRFGPGHPFTWMAQLDLARVLLRSADAADAGSADYAAEGRRLTELLAGATAGRFGAGHRSALDARILHADALILLGQAGAAMTEVAYAMAVARRVGAVLEPGLAQELLARAQAAAGDGRALSTARAALRLRAGHFPVGSIRVEHCLHLVDQLSREERRSSS